MKKLALFALCVLPQIFAPAQAGELTAEPAATAYWEIPLGTTRAGKPQPSFGLRMDQVVRDNQGFQRNTVAQTPVVDFRFNASGLQGMYVHGINMASPGIMKLGVVDTVTLVVLGTAAVVTTAIIVEGHNDSAPACPPLFAFNFSCVGYAPGVACCT